MFDRLQNEFASRPVDLVGVDCDVGGSRFRLRALSPRNRDLVAFIAARGLASLGDATVDLLPDLLTKCAVVDWSLIDDGEPVPFSADAARELFGKHPMLAQRVFVRALEIGDVEAQAVADAKKPAPGGVSGAASDSNTCDALPLPVSTFGRSPTDRAAA